MHEKVIAFGNNVRSKDVKSIYYLITFLINFSSSLIMATYVLFLLSKGLDLFQVMVVNFAFMASNFIFEIPTGAYADYFGRRKSIILSCLFLCICFGIYFISSNIYMFILAEIIGALHFTFASGALDAWMVDAVKRKDFTDKVDYIFSNAEVVGKTASLVGGLLGAYIGSVHLALPFGAAALVALISLFVSLLFIKEEFIQRKTLNILSSIIQMGQVARDSVNYGLKHKVMFWLICASLLAAFAFQPINMYWSPRMNSLSGDKIQLLGWVWAGMCLFMIVGSSLIKEFLKREKTYLWILITTVFVLSVPIFFSATTNVFTIAICTFFFYEIGRGMLTPVHKSYLNKYIPSEQRATVLSFESMMTKFGAAGGLLVMGWIGKNYSIETSWIVSGILLLFLIPLYLQAAKQEKNI
jgi:MFS family permease